MTDISISHFSLYVEFHISLQSGINQGAVKSEPCDHLILICMGH